MSTANGWPFAAEAPADTRRCARLVFHNVFAAGASYYGVADLERLRRIRTSSNRDMKMVWSARILTAEDSTGSVRRFTLRIGCRVR